jgi:hypothetical protein
MAFRVKRGGRDEQATKVMTSLLDEIDEERARRLRSELGQQRRWLVSWQGAEGGSWTARVSGPDYPETIERTGLTRAHAIELAAEALGRCLKPSRARDII